MSASHLRFLSLDQYACVTCQDSDGNLVLQKVKNPPAMQEARVQSLGGEIPWRRKWHLLLILPGESHGPRSLASCSPWDHKQSDMTE